VKVEVKTESGSAYHIDGDKLTGGALGNERIPEKEATLFPGQRFVVGLSLLAFLKDGKYVSTSPIESMAILT